MIATNNVYQGDSISSLSQLDPNSTDLIYFDPPFFTQKEHSLKNKDLSKIYSFSDKYATLADYLNLIENTLTESFRVLKDTGSVFLHCDKTASHQIRILLDKVFGPQNFQSEIIWSYKRWSNSKKGLLNAHQIIFFYSKTNNFKFNTLYNPYSPTTNLDQILQDRERNHHGKSVYKKDKNGNIILGKPKKGVPLSDVWDIPYLNPKAKERCGYPTQKPVQLLNKILEIATNEGDLVIDPFCGSGTTCVSAKLLNRSYLGFDISKDAVELAKKRLQEMIISRSNLLEVGLSEYLDKSDKELEILNSINALPVQRNVGIDGFLKEHFMDAPVPVKIQKHDETLEDAMQKLKKASLRKGYSMKILVQTKIDNNNRFWDFQTDITVIKTLEIQAKEISTPQSDKSSLINEKVLSL